MKDNGKVSKQRIPHSRVSEGDLKTEVRRGRKFVEYHDPDTQDPNTFTQEISGADVSYQDEVGNWLQTDENWQADGLGRLECVR